MRAVTFTVVYMGLPGYSFIMLTNRKCVLGYSFIKDD